MKYDEIQDELADMLKKVKNMNANIEGSDDRKQKVGYYLTRIQEDIEHAIIYNVSSSSDK